MKKFITLAALLITVMASAQNYNYGKYSKEIFEQLRLINEARAKMGFSQLVMDSVLFKGARHRCEEISQKFSHTRPNGKPFSTVFSKKTRLDIGEMGENIAIGYKTPKEAFDIFWKSRKGHRENMMGQNWNRVGICYNPIKERWVQIFAE